MHVSYRNMAAEKATRAWWCTVAEDRAAYTRTAQQMSLFDTATRAQSNGQEAFRDPAFRENRSLPVHRWVPWIAGYSAAFVDDVISAYIPAGKTALVLDPFCGVGTTLLQAVWRGHSAIGFEINPYPVLATHAKLSAATIDLAELDTTLKALQALSSIWRTTAAPRSIVPPSFKSRLPFFSSVVEKQVLHALDFVNTIASEPIANLYRVAFGAMMVSFSNYSYEPSLGSRPAAGKPLVEEADVNNILLTKLHQMHTDIAHVQAALRGQQLGAGRVINADFFSAHEELETGSVDVMVTSPPYMNNYHYVRNTRPQLYWLNFIASPREQKPLETHNFGQYWQTVRDVAPVALTFAHRELAATLAQLRATRTAQGAYGGPGWANYVATYFNDCCRFMTVLKRVLARGGIGVVVIGNSIIQGLDIRTECLLGEIAVMQGLLLEGVYCIRDKRVGASITQSSVRQGTRSKATLSEFAVVVRQP
jgi:hypothetical protein